MDKDPTGTFFGAIGARSANPVCLKDQPVQRRRNDVPDNPDAKQRQ